MQINFINTFVFFQDTSVNCDIPNDHAADEEPDLKTDKSESLDDTHKNNIDLEDLPPDEDDSSCCSSDSFTSCTSTCSERCTPSTNSSSSGTSERHASNQDRLVNNRCVASLKNIENTPARKSLNSHLNSPVILTYKETNPISPNSGVESPETEVVKRFESGSSIRYSSEVITCYNGYHDIIMPNSPQTGVFINFTPKPAKNLQILTFTVLLLKWYIHIYTCILLVSLNHSESIVYWASSHSCIQILFIVYLLLPSCPQLRHVNVYIVFPVLQCKID